jgi:hypothetical protein
VRLTLRKHSATRYGGPRSFIWVGRRVDVEQLVGVTEIAQRLGLKTAGTVHDWRRRYPEFPEPVAKLAMGVVFVWPDVEAWARRKGRL